MAILQKRKTDDPCSRITLASVESLTLPLVQEVVLLADFRCKGCQERVADIMSRMNGVTQSVVISVMDKKVTLTSTYPGIFKVRRGQVTRIYENSKNKVSHMMGFFRFSCS